MPNHHFISYSATDAEKFALKLADDLQAGPPAFPVWIFRRELHVAAGDWDTQIREAIRDCESLIFVMTRDSVTDESNCKPEWTAALKFKKPILLVRFHADADTPFRIASRQYIDFVGDYNVGLAKLRKDLQWLHSPEGELETLKYRLQDAERDFNRAPDADRPRIQADIDLLRKQIAEQTEAVKNPAAAARRTEASIAAGLEREREPAKPISGKTRTKFINPPPATAPRYFQDRYEENKIVANFLRDDACRLLTINGRAGIGKTAMVCRLLKSLESGHLPDDLGEMSVDGIVYLSAVGTRPINTPNLFADLCLLLSTETAHQLDALYRDPKISTTNKLFALLEKFPSGRIVVLLDNFESVVDDECCVKDAELDEALRALLRAPHHAIKIILTTRVAPRDLNLIEAGRQAMLHLDEGLESPFAENVLRECDADGKVGLKNAPADLLKRARERTRGFPRALEALYAILSADRYTSLEEILGVGAVDVGAFNKTPLPMPLPENVVAALVGEAFSRLDPTAQRVMQGLAAYARPVPPAAVDYLLQPHFPSIDGAPVLNRLVNMQFAHRESGKYYLHPTDCEYAWSRVLPLSPSPTRRDGESGSAGERETSFTQRAVLTRAADYFRDARKPRETWKTLADLEPQLNEFDLRCAADDYDTAASVLLEIDGEYLFLWGHYRLMAEMHERLQGKIDDANLKRQSVGNLGSCYYSTGQVQKAIDCYDKALAFAREAKNRQAEGAWLGNLGNAYSNLGDTRRAIQLYEQALAIQREIGDKQCEGNQLGNLGNCYADLGQTQRAIEFYEQALAIAREIGDRASEGRHLGNLGNRYADLGQTQRAIEFYEQALAIAREIGDKRGEGRHLGNLGNRYAELGQTQRAIEFYEQALAIAREIGDKHNEGAWLGNLGSAYADLGQTQRASGFYEQALAIAREIGDKQHEGVCYSQLGSAFVNLGKLESAVEYYEQGIAVARETGYRYGEAFRLFVLAGTLIDANRLGEAVQRASESIKIGEEIHSPIVCNNTSATLALAHLYAGNLSAAHAAAESARQYDVPQNNHNVLALLGIIALRQNERAAAQEAFTAAIAHADALLAQTPQYYGALDAKGVALCGLGLCRGGVLPPVIPPKSAPVAAPAQMGDMTSPLQAAVAAFRAARTINKDAGVVARIVRLLDALALAAPDGAELLAEARKAASGE